MCTHTHIGDIANPGQSLSGLAVLAWSIHHQDGGITGYQGAHLCVCVGGGGGCGCVCGCVCVCVWVGVCVCVCASQTVGV